jgi:hypothetical protein
MDGKQLNESDTERDLGVIFSTNLKWKIQIINASSNANRILGIIKKNYRQF